MLGNMCMHSPCTLLPLLCLTHVSCFVLVQLTGLDSDHCLPACLPVCVHVLFLHNHLHYRLLSSLPSSEGYEKSRSLNNIAGMTSMAGNTLRLSPVTSPYGSPCPLRRSRSPIPSILWDVHFLPALAQSHAHILVPNRAPAFGNKPELCSWWDWRKSS